MKTKRFVAFFLTVCLLAGLCCVPAFAEVTDSGSCGDNVKWSFDASTGTLTFTGTGTIPESPYGVNATYGKYQDEIVHLVIKEGITDIAPRCFSDFGSLKSVRIADSVKTIGDMAFSDNRRLTKVHLGNGVTTIGSGAFCSCFELTDITLPSSLTSLSNCVFIDCYMIKNIAIPEGITLIDNSTFQNCKNMTHIYIPASVTKVNCAAFRWCDALEHIYYGGTLEQWNAIVVDDTVDEHRGNNEALSRATVHYNHSHSWNSGTVISTATCAKDGVKAYSCTCGAVKQDTYSVAHNWDSGSVTAATCTKDGAKVFTCTACKQTKTETISAAGHLWDNGTESADTTISYNCKNCSAIKIEGTPVVPTETTAPTTQATEPSTTATDGTTASTADTTLPARDTEPSVEKSFPWGIVIGISLAVLAGGAGLLIWWKKKS